MYVCQSFSCLCSLHDGTYTTHVPYCIMRCISCVSFLLHTSRYSNTSTVLSVVLYESSLLSTSTSTLIPLQFNAPASSSIPLKVPLNAKATMPGASSPTPPSKPPTYSPPIKTHGTDDLPTFLPRAARMRLPSLHGSSRRMILTLALVVSNASTAFLQDGDDSHVNMTVEKFRVRVFVLDLFKQINQYFNDISPRHHGIIRVDYHIPQVTYHREPKQWPHQSLPPQLSHHTPLQSHRPKPVCPPNPLHWILERCGILF